MPAAVKKAVSQQRARSVEDKDLRRAHLIDAATRLFADSTFEAVTIARVAELAGVAKGTAYLYFATKETLFLELARAELTLWVQALIKKLQRLRLGSGASQPAQAVPAAMARCAAERPALGRLLVLLHSVIEPNIDEAAARDFKLYLRDLLAQASEAIANKIPGLTLDDAATLVLQMHALVISLSQLANPPPVIARVMAADPTLQSMQIDFEPFLAATLTTLVRGTLAAKTAG
jgi:AcrR family transcriptional regulator